jgi:hypothetical protein
MKVAVLTRRCECGSRVNAGIHNHADGCPRNYETAPFRVRILNIKVVNHERWSFVKVLVAGFLFYFGLAWSASSDFSTPGYWWSATMIGASIAVLMSACRSR